MTSRISVVIPCYNGERYVSAAIESVLRQTRPADEIVVVDDGSSDRSADVVATFGPRVRLVRQSNKGEGGARNTGASAVTGTHILFLDADDLLVPDALERLGAAADANPTAMILMRAVPFATDPCAPIGGPSPVPHGWFPELIHGCLGVPHAWLTPVDVHRRTSGFTTTQKYFVDWQYWCQAALQNPPLIVLDFVGALYRRHGATMSATTPPIARVRGHVAVMETLAEGALLQPALLAAHGADLFWCCWTALDRARQAAVSWSDLERLTRAMTGIARSRPGRLDSALSATLTRRFGLRFAYWMRSLSNRSPHGSAETSIPPDSLAVV